jgi:DNA-binding NarL/FixJ family response regulator
MPDFSGLSAVKKLQEAQINAKVIVLTMHSEPELAVEAFRLGVNGYLLKQSAPKEVLTAIEEVMQGRVYLTPLIASGVINAMLGQGTAVKEPSGASEIQLSPRQREVLRLVAQGLTMKEIGNVLNISSRTVEAHKYEMMQSLGAATTAQLIQFAFKFGILADD